MIALCVVTDRVRPGCQCQWIPMAVNGYILVLCMYVCLVSAYRCSFHVCFLAGVLSLYMFGTLPNAVVSRGICALSVLIDWLFLYNMLLLVAGCFWAFEYSLIDWVTFKFDLCCMICLWSTLPDFLNYFLKLCANITEFILIYCVASDKPVKHCFWFCPTSLAMNKLEFLLSGFL